MRILGEPHGQPSDEELLARMLGGEAEALSALYDRRHGAIYRFALRMSGSAALAEDVTQEVFLALMRDGSGFDPSRGSLSAYLFGMARHRVLRRLEKERAMLSLDDREGEEAETQADTLIALDDPLADLSRQEMIESVRRAVLALPLHYREVVTLCSLHDLSYEQAAEIIGCPVGTVRSRLARARAMLSDKLRAYGGNRAASAM